MQVPVTWKIDHIRSKSRENRAVIHPHLPIRLGVVCRREGVLSAHHLVFTVEDPRNEALPVVHDEVFWWSVIENLGVDKASSDLYRRLTIEGDCLFELSESLDDH